MKGYVAAPLSWLYAPDLSMQDITRLIRLWCKYDGFVNLSKMRGHVDYLHCFYPSQRMLCELMGFTEGSQSRVSKILKDFEKKGYIKRFKTAVKTKQGFVPRHYIVVLNPESCYYTEQIKQVEMKNANIL